MGHSKPNLDNIADKYPNKDLERDLREHISDSIKEFCAAEMAEETGIPKSTLSKYLAKSSTASAINAVLIAEASGRVFRPQSASQSIRKLGRGEPNLDNPREEQSTSGFTLIPRYSISASAGPGDTPGEELEISVVSLQTSFLRELGADPRRCSAIVANGDSMEPTIPDKSVIIVDHSQRTVKHGCIYVVNYADDLLVKRVHRKIGGSIELASDNARYPVEHVADNMVERLEVVGRVVYFCREP